MAKRFRKEGSAGMQGPLRGPLWGEFCYLLSSKPPLFCINPQSQTERRAKSSRRRQGRRSYSLPLVSHLKVRALHCNRSECVQRGRETGTTESKNTR